MSAYPLNAAVGAGWTKVLDKKDMKRYGDLVGLGGDVDLAYEAAPASPEMVVASTAQLVALDAYRDLYARSAGGVGSATLAGMMVDGPDLWNQNRFIDAEEIIYKGQDLEDLLDGSSQFVIDVEPNGMGDFTKVQDAIDAAPLGSGTTIKVFPGIYNENVVLKRGVFLRSAGYLFAGAKDVIIRSASGDTLQIPHRDSGAWGVCIQSSGPNPTDVATRVIDDGLGAGLETFMVMFFTESMPGAQAQALHSDPLPPNENAILLWAGVDADTTAPVAMEIDAGFLVWFLGGCGGNGAQTGIKMNPGSGLMLGAQVGINADLVAGRVVDADQGFLLCLDCTVDGFNGIRGLNGSNIVLAKVQSFGGMAGTPVETDVVSACFMGSQVLEGFGGAPYSGFNLQGPVFRIWKGGEGGGTMGNGGPDQRPTAGGSQVAEGFRFTARDITPGIVGGPGPWTGGDIVLVNGQWVDGTGTVHP